MIPEGEKVAEFCRGWDGSIHRWNAATYLIPLELATGSCSQLAFDKGLALAEFSHNRGSQDLSRYGFV